MTGLMGTLLLENDKILDYVGERGTTFSSIQTHLNSCQKAEKWA